MTRLIDVDALNLEYEVDMADDWKTAHEIANIVKYAPTIEAIPIEFIQKRIDQLKEINERLFMVNGGYTSPSDYEQWELQRLVRDWREENDKTD